MGNIKKMDCEVEDIVEFFEYIADGENILKETFINLMNEFEKVYS